MAGVAWVVGKQTAEMVLGMMNALPDFIEAEVYDYDGCKSGTYLGQVVAGEKRRVEGKDHICFRRNVVAASDVAYWDWLNQDGSNPDWYYFCAGEAQASCYDRSIKRKVGRRMKLPIYDDDTESDRGGDQVWKLERPSICGRPHWHRGRQSR